MPEPPARPVLWRSVDDRLTATVRHGAAMARGLLVCVHGGGCTGRYFDLRGFSFAELALARGYAVAMVDRPGYGGSAPPLSDDPIAEAAALVARHAPALADAVLPAPAPVALVGHSIGGAVVLESATALAGVVSAIVVSGIGAAPSAAARHSFAQAQAGLVLDPPPELFFGPDGSFDWRGPIALRAAAAPWRGDEVRELLHRWPERIRTIGAMITQPVHLRLAEHERLWDIDNRALADLRTLFERAATVDAGLMPDGGHLYEVHRNGRALGQAQLDFLDAWLGAGAPGPATLDAGGRAD